MHPMLNTAVKAARRAGDIIIRFSRNLEDVTFQEKARNDYVSEVDRQAEQAIISILLDAYPKHAILAEESGAAGASEYCWIIDPLDGTTNFLHGFPHYAVSIALAHQNIVTQAVIYDPVRNDLFTASRGNGAYLNDRRTRVSKCGALKDALLGTGFPFRDMDRLDEYVAAFRVFTGNTAGIRRAGAATLDLAYVAAGKLDGFWEMGLKPWDMAAGALLITESGGFIGDLQGEAGFMESGDVLAGSPKIFARMLHSLEQAKVKLSKV